MREIKFRAYLKDVFGEAGEMVYFSLFGTDSGYIIKEGRSVFDDDPVMQYTGLKDKKGKEIYEGDIVTYDDSVMLRMRRYIKPKVVEYISGSFYPFCGCGSEGEYSMETNKAIIIGNVHEHPELLEGSQ